MNTVVFNYKGLVINELKNQGLSYCDLEELTQDVLVKAWKSYDKFDNQKGNLSTWIKTIARNTLIDFFRKKRFQYVELDTIQDVSESQDCLYSEEKEVVERVFDIVKERDKLILDLYFIQGLKHKEIAEQLGLPVNRIGQEIKRASNRFKNKAEQIGITKSIIMAA